MYINKHWDRLAKSAYLGEHGNVPINIVRSVLWNCRSKKGVDVILSGVERDAEGRIVGATAVLSTYILKDQTNTTNLQGQLVSRVNVGW